MYIYMYIYIYIRSMSVNFRQIFCFISRPNNNGQEDALSSPKSNKVWQGFYSNKVYCPRLGYVYLKDVEEFTICNCFLKMFFVVVANSPTEFIITFWFILRILLTHLHSMVCRYIDLEPGCYDWNPQLSRSLLPTRQFTLKREMVSRKFLCVSFGNLLPPRYQ